MTLAEVFDETSGAPAPRGLVIGNGLYSSIDDRSHIIDDTLPLSFNVAADRQRDAAALMRRLRSDGRLVVPRRTNACRRCAGDFLSITYDAMRDR
jgi:hypothetical protein